MAALKCKMCGGDLIIEEGKSVAECDYCGIRQTVPSADNEKKMALFARAHKLRFNCEFDKASGIYESIIADFPEEAEAYWGLVLCKYGIEYVDDPATGNKVPTCHRSSFESIMEDDDFEQVMENADTMSRSVYREEAKQIEELRKSIIEVSSREEPYDIFICYKETDENGERTVDSAIAQDVYDALTQNGYRVFFSRITLEDKLGQEYEPYIFAALNSAKIMLAFGTSYDYYNAVWVKNEWSRFLQLIAKGEKKYLIPCYKNIDAYDMPKEFAKLQAQNMGTVGAIQLLLRGIENILPKKDTVGGKEQAAAQQSTPQSATVDTLLKRAYMYLEDGDWKNAEDYFNRVLDIVPENADAYLGKLMAEYKVKKESDLQYLQQRIDLSTNYKRVLNYGSDDIKQRLKSYDAIIRNRIGQKNLQLQEIENKKKEIQTEVFDADEKLQKAEAERESIQKEIDHRTGGAFAQLETKIKAKNIEIAKCNENIKKVVPVILTLIVLFAAIAILALAVLGIAVGGGRSAPDFIPSYDSAVGMVIIECIVGVLFLSFVYAYNNHSGALFFAMLLGGGCIYLLMLIICACIENGGVLNVIFKVLYNVAIGWLLGGDDVLTSATYLSAAAFSTAAFFIIAFILGCKESHTRRKSKKAMQTLLFDLGKLQGEYDRSKASLSGELAQLSARLEVAKKNCDIILSDNRSRLRKLNLEYNKLAAAANVRAEALIPQKYL